MKTAEEWSKNVVFDIGCRRGILRSEFASVICAIQLDAVKHGITLAAGIAYEREPMRREVELAILHARDNLTTL